MVPIVLATPAPPAIPQATPATPAGGDSCSPSFSSSLHSFLDRTSGSATATTQSDNSQNAQAKAHPQACAVSASDEADQPDAAAVTDTESKVLNPDSTRTLSPSGNAEKRMASAGKTNRSTEKHFHLSICSPMSGAVLPVAAFVPTVVPSPISATFCDAPRTDSSPAGALTMDDNGKPVDQTDSDTLEESPFTASNPQDVTINSAAPWIAYASGIDDYEEQNPVLQSAVNGNAPGAGADTSAASDRAAEPTAGPTAKVSGQIRVTQSPLSDARDGTVSSASSVSNNSSAKTSALAPSASPNGTNAAANMQNSATANILPLASGTSIKTIEKALSHSAADGPATIIAVGKAEVGNCSQPNVKSGDGNAGQQGSQADSSGATKKQTDNNSGLLPQAHATVSATQPVQTDTIVKGSAASVGATNTDSTVQTTTVANANVVAPPTSTAVSSTSAALSNAPSAAPQAGQPSGGASVAAGATAAPPPGAVTSGQLFQHANQSEIRVSLDSTTLGAIELRATMRNDMLSAAIGVSKSDVQTFLAAELPALHHILAEQNLRVASLTLTDRSFGARGGLSEGEQQRNGNFRPYTALGSSGSSDAENTNSPAPVSTDVAMGNASRGRLSIHA